MKLFGVSTLVLTLVAEKSAANINKKTVEEFNQDEISNPTTSMLDYAVECADIKLSDDSCTVQFFFEMLSSPEELMMMPIATPMGNYSAMGLYETFYLYLDTNNDGTISDEELDVVKRVLDLNQDGVISLDELANAERYLVTMFPFMFPFHLNQTTGGLEETLFVDNLELYDLDHDGILSDEEKQHAMQVVQAFYEEIYPTQKDLFLVLQQLQKDNEGLGEIMNLLDMDSDGSFNESDLVSLQSVITGFKPGQVNLDNFNLTIDGTSIFINDENVTQVLSILYSMVDENIKLVLEDYFGGFLNSSSSLDETKAEVFETLDLNQDGIIDAEEMKSIQAILFGMYEENIYPGQIPFFLNETFDMMKEDIDIELAYSIFMNDTRVSDEDKEILTSVIDLDGDGYISENDFDQGTALLLGFYDEIVDTSSPGARSIPMEMNNVNRVETKCELPLLDDALIVEIAASSAFDHCKDTHEAMETINGLQSLFGASECISSLCLKDSQKQIIWEWMETCTDVELPPPSTMKRKNMFDDIYAWTSTQTENQQDAILECMMNHTMSSVPQDFDLEQDIPPLEEINSPPALGLINQCYLPGFMNMAEKTCSERVAPLAFQMCIENIVLSAENHDSEEDFFGFSYQYEYSFSYNYDFSFSYDYNNSGGSGDDDKMNDYPQESFYIDKFCSIMTELSSDKGQECMLPICQSVYSFKTEGDQEPHEDNDGVTNFQSSAPVVAPSMIPSIATSSAPSSAPTLRHLNQPEIVKSVEVKFQASVSFDSLTVEDIPPIGPELDAMVQVLQNAISNNLPVGSSARIIKIAGIPVNGGLTRRRRRRLDGTVSGVEVEFEVTKKIECDGNDCSGAIEESNTFYTAATTQLNTAVADGSLESDIEEEATISGVTVLQIVEVKEDSFSSSSLETSILEEVIETNNDDENDDEGESNDTSTARKWIYFPKTFMLSAIISVLFHF